MIYISGTAAIRGEESIVTGDVLVQTEITLENIQHLIGLEEGREKLPEHSGKLPVISATRRAAISGVTAFRQR